MIPMLTKTIRIIQNLKMTNEMNMIGESVNAKKKMSIALRMVKQEKT